MSTREADAQPGLARREGLELALRYACLALAVLIWLPGLRLLSRIWQESDFFAHGYFIPVVTLWLLYSDRAAIWEALREETPPLFGFVPVFASACLVAVAISADITTAAGVGIPLVLGSTAYALGGRRAFVRVRMPLFLLLFMVPPPGGLLDLALVRLKLFVTGVAVSILRLFDYPILAEGNQLQVPGSTLFVADACSGMISIVTLLPVAVILAYFLGRGVVRRVVIVASVLPLAVAANIVRIVVTVLLVTSFGAEWAQGVLHESFGMTTFALGTAALVLVARALR